MVFHSTVLGYTAPASKSFADLMHLNFDTVFPSSGSKTSIQNTCMCKETLWRFDSLIINRMRRTRTPNAEAAYSGAASHIPVLMQNNCLVFPMHHNSCVPLYFCTRQNNNFHLVTTYSAKFMKLKSSLQAVGNLLLDTKEAILLYISSIRLGLFYFVLYLNCWIFGDIKIEQKCFSKK